MAAKFLFLLATLQLLTVNGQIPGFGRCPEYDAMPDFDKEKFMGTWYEVERYFSVTDVVSKCISADYERRADGQIYVKNYYTNRINNVQRIISGKLSLTGKGGEGRFTVRYESFPINYDASLVVLDTDYKNYAVMWSCSNVTPLGHTESAWLMGRQRIPRGEVLQAAYGVLDKYKMNRSFFVKSEQDNCEVLPPIQEAVDSMESSAAKTKNPVQKTENIVDNSTTVAAEKSESVSTEATA